MHEWNSWHFGISAWSTQIHWKLLIFTINFFAGHLLKDLNAKQNVISCLRREKGSRISSGKGPQTNKPEFERPAHGRNVKRFDGEFVHRGEILVTQNGLKYYPGENVSKCQNVGKLKLTMYM